MARRAVNRAFLAELVRQGGRWLFIGSAAGLVLVGGGKLLGAGEEWPWLLLSSVAAGAVISLAVAGARRWSLLRAAAELDAALDLRGALGSALELAHSQRGPFEDWTIAHAESIAPGLSPARVIPIRFGWGWSAWPAMVACALIAAMYIPQWHWRRVPTEVAPSAAKREEAAAQVHRVQQALSAAAENPGQALATPAQLAALQELQKELESGRVDPQAALAQAAKSVSEMSDRLEETAHAEQAEAGSLRDQLASAAGKAAEGQSPGTPEGSALTESLRKGDLDAASEAADNASAHAGELSPAEREQLVKVLEQLADSLSSADKPAGEATEKTRENAVAPSAQTAAHDQASSSTPPGSPDSKPPRNENDIAQSERAPAHDESGSEQSSSSSDSKGAQGHPQEPPSRPKEQQAQGAPRTEGAEKPGMPEERSGEKEPGPEEQTRRERQDLIQSARDAAKELRNGGAGQKKEAQSPQAPNQEGHPSGEQKPAKPGASDTKESKTQADQGQRGNPSGPSSDGANRTQSKSAGDKPAQQEHANPDTGTQSNDGDKSQKPGQSDQPSPTGEKQPSGAEPTQSHPEQPGAQQDTSAAQHQGGGEQSSKDQAPKGDPNGRESDEPSNSPAQQTPGGTKKQTDERRQGVGATEPGREQGMAPAGSQESGEKSPPSSGLGQALRQIAAREREAKEAQRIADRARQVAKEMTKDLTPEEREQFQQLVNDMAQGAGPGSGKRTLPPTGVAGSGAHNATPVPVDVRRAAEPGDKARERVIAEWYSDRPADRQGQGTARADALREAAQSAEHALEQQAVPARYSDLVRGVFRRYSQQPPEPPPK